MDTFSAFEDMDLVVTFTAVFVAGLAAVLGIWMERDPKKPPRYAWALSALILLATFVSLMQSFLDKTEQDQIKDDMARLLTTMDRLANESDDPALLELVKAELNAQSRAHPEVVERVAQRVSDEGRDAGEVLGKHLDAAEIENVTRKGAIKAKGTDKVVRTENAEAPVGEAPVGEPRTRPPRARAGAADAEPTLETAAAPTRPGATGDDPPARAARAPIPAPTPEPVAVEPAPPIPAPTVETAAAPSKPRAGRAPRPGTPRAPGTKRPEPRSRSR